MKILVTGGAGYIGSHILVELIQNNHQPIVVDNLSNSSEEAIRRVEKLTNSQIPFYKADLLDEVALAEIFKQHNFEAVIHLAALKSVSQSVEMPMLYYKNNVLSTINLLQQMQTSGVSNLLFSSSATVYGQPDSLPVTEDAPANRASNPYGQTKVINETILKDFSSNANMSVVSLRYSNPIGAHPSGQIGEDPHDIPNNLLPYITQVAIGKLEKLKVYGSDYPTTDGTGVRDYLHVVDLAKGHVAAIEHLKPGFNVYNLASNHGASVLEVIKSFEEATTQTIPYEMVARRQGDIAEFHADASKAKAELAWQCEQSLQDACRDAWHWQQQNPNGYL